MKDGDKFRKLKTVQYDNKVVQTINIDDKVTHKELWDLSEPKIAENIKNGVDGPQKLINQFINKSEIMKDPKKCNDIGG